MKQSVLRNQLRYMDIKRASMRSETREDGAMVLEGIAVVYDTPTVLWSGSSEEDREIILKGAAADSVAGDDVRSLWNHDTGIVLGRTTAGTLELEDADEGVRFRLVLPDSEEGRNKYASVMRGDVNQMSYRFDALKYTLDIERDEEREKTIYTSRVSQMRLYEISPVTFPAYETTEVHARAHDERKRLQAAQEASRAAERAAARDEVLSDVLFLAKHS